MTATVPEAGERTDTAHADNENHIVSDLQHWLSRLGLKIPRALCGELLVAGPGYVENRLALLCQRCAELTGRPGGGA